MEGPSSGGRETGGGDTREQGRRGALSSTVRGGVRARVGVAPPLNRTWATPKPLRFGKTSSRPGVTPERKGSKGPVSAALEK